MDIIHLLPDTVANQIAAGEVVQRPSSVIKELLENSIDAGATSVQIILREAGRDLIQVIDNGKGMSPTDARMAFEKHATSKIQQAADLFNLHTMGFRGEALASIAAVAEVELRTRRKDDEAGVLIALAGSQFQRQEVIACPVGANFQVRNLFYNVPARRKFLKSNQTELSNIMSEVQHVALANPEVEFVVVHNDQQVLNLPAAGLKQRIIQLFSKSLGTQLLPVSVENDMLSVSGFVCQPEGARRKGALQYFFVNDRYMKHPYFHRAVMECYQELILEGSQPNYFLYLKVDPQTIDVNIHPTKTEIKFENEAARWHILMAAIREALGKYNAVPSIDFDQDDAPEIQPAVRDNTHVPVEPKVNYAPGYNPFRQPSASHWQSLYDELPSRMSKPSASAAAEPAGAASLVPPPVYEELSSAMDLLSDLPASEQPSAPAASPQTFLQVGGRFLVLPARGGMTLVDPHRAHIAVLYDRYLQQIANRQGLSQQELFPEIVEIAPADQPILESIMADLGYLGFELDNLGGGSWAINGKPASLDASVDIHDLLAQMIDVARQQVHDLGESLDRQLALRLAHAQAIPYGRPLSGDEAQQLLESLMALAEHTHTPDGQRIMAQVTNAQLSSYL